MLRESAIAFRYDLNVAAIRDPSLSIGVPGGTELLCLVDISIGISDDSIANVHSAIIELLGPEALVDAAAVFGNFQMMNRVAEGTGIPTPSQTIQREADTIDTLNIRRFIKS